MRPRASTALGSLLLGISACTLTTPDVGGPLRRLREQQREQADRVAAAFCAAYYSCDCSERFPSHEDEAECLEVIADGLVHRLEQGINDELDYDPECLEANLALYEAIGCANRDAVALDTLAYDIDLHRTLDRALRCRTYHGPRQLHEECTPLASARGGECLPDLTCDDRFSMCLDVTVLGEGEPCGEDPLRACDAGLWCAGSSTGAQDVCLRPTAVGTGCLDTSVCQLGAWCDPVDATCRTLPVLGEPCESQLGDACGVGLRCVQGQCVRQAVAGEPCTEECGPGTTCGDDDRCEPLPPMICSMEAQLP